MQPTGRIGARPYDAPIAATDASAATPAPAPAVGGAGRTSAREHLPAFEGLRALAAVAVATYHAASLTGVVWGRGTGIGDAGAWLQHLSAGVPVFFVLSGFLLYRPFVLAHLERRPLPRTGAFLLRRSVRIYPAYWVALLVSQLWLPLELGDWWGHLRFYSLTHIYWSDTVLGGLIPAWSLCTEVSFYLFLPLWAAAMARVRGSVERRIRAHYLGLGALVVLGVGVRLWLVDGEHALGFGTLPANVQLFAAGMALAVASVAAREGARPLPSVLRTIADAPAAALVAAFCCYAGIVSVGFPEGLALPTVGEEAARQVLVTAMAGLLVAVGALAPARSGAVRTLTWPPLVYLGIVSYGIYLWHLTLEIELGRGDHAIVPASVGWVAVAGIAASVVVASASWFLLERPLLTWARAVSQRSAPRAAGARRRPAGRASRGRSRTGGGPRRPASDPPGDERAGRRVL